MISIYLRKTRDESSQSWTNMHVDFDRRKDEKLNNFDDDWFMISETGEQTIITTSSND